MTGNFYMLGKQEKINISQLIQEVTAIETKLDDPDSGLETIKTLITENKDCLESLEETLAKFIPIAKGSVFNAAVVAGVDIFTAAITPTNTPCIFWIYANFDAAGVLTVRRTYGGVTIDENLNSGADLTADSPASFDIIVDAGESINLRYGVNANALKVSIIEQGVVT